MLPRDYTAATLRRTLISEKFLDIRTGLRQSFAISVSIAAFSQMGTVWIFELAGK
jgi:hypothetical protein